MNKLLQKPAQEPPMDSPARFEKFNLKENPFPSEPVINKDSKDHRINGSIYEVAIRQKERHQIDTEFLKQPQSNPNHLRLGYIMDTSYISRGNGKTAFLVNLYHEINKKYCLDLSNGLNKCFAVHMQPELGGRTKTFLNYIDLFYKSILYAGIVDDCLAILRLNAIAELYPELLPSIESIAEDALIANLKSKDWFSENNIDGRKVANSICDNKYLQELPPEFPIFGERNSLLTGFLVSQESFKSYYMNLRRGKERLDFVFSHLVRFFQAASFNGAYIFVDDFERVPDFQSARQKKDFALELRSCLFDGSYVSARTGFYVFFLVLHAGVPHLISDAWAGSGLENRAPLSLRTMSKHIIPFERLDKAQASLLLKRYLAEYRIEPNQSDALSPFTEAAVNLIGELAEYNATNILKMAYELLDKASEVPDRTVIDEEFVNLNKDSQTIATNTGRPTLEAADSTDLLKKAKKQE
jgi:hypothetical protein